MMEASRYRSGSVPLTNGSGRPKTMIRNTVRQVISHGVSVTVV